MSIIKRGNKEVVSIKINNKSLYIESLKVNAIALESFNIKYQDATEEMQSQIKDKIRDICKDLKEINTQSVDDEIFLHFLPKYLKNRLTNVN